MFRRVVLSSVLAASGVASAIAWNRRQGESNKFSFSAFAQQPAPKATPQASSASAPPANSTVVVKASSSDSSEAVKVKYLIVGAGIAAVHAVNAIRELDKEGKILVVDGSTNGAPIERPVLSKELLWYGADNASPLSFQLPHESQTRSAEIDLPLADDNLSWRYGAYVTDIDADAKAVLVGGSNDDPTSGQVIFFEKCLLATGSTPHRLREYAGGRLMTPDTPFESGSPVTAFRDAEDYIRLRGVMSTAQHVAIVGGGFTAAELAVGLRRAFPKVRVSMLFQEDFVLSKFLPSDVARKVTAEVLRHGVEVHPSTDIQVLDRSRPGYPVAIFTSNELQPPIEVDHVVLAVGQQPATRFAEMADLEVDEKTGGIVVNSELAARTDIYAAGDIAYYFDSKLSRRNISTSYDHAAKSGRVAGRNMTGLREQYQHTPMFWSQIGDMRIETVGRTDPSLQTVGVWDEIGREDPNNAKKAHGVVYYVDKNRIVGMMLCNVDAQTDNARAIVQRRKLYYDKKILMSLLSIERGDHQL